MNLTNSMLTGLLHVAGKLGRNVPKQTIGALLARKLVVKSKAHGYILTDSGRMAVQAYRLGLAR